MEKRGDYLEKGTEEQTFLKKSKIPEKKTFRLNIPTKLRASLSWVIFFALIGIIIQSVQSGTFVFRDFFGTNFINWFKEFGFFVERATEISISEFFYKLLSSWYYFFYTGGLISLLWECISSMLNSEIKFVYKK